MLGFLSVLFNGVASFWDYTASEQEYGRQADCDDYDDDYDDNGDDDDDGLKKRRAGKSRRRRSTADASKCRKTDARMKAQQTCLAVLEISAFSDYATRI